MTRDPAAVRRRNRAVQLLTRLIAGGQFERTRIAAELVVDGPTLDRFIAGEIDMPLDRQACLARFLVAHVPPLERAGHNLIAQVRAAQAYAESETTTHLSAPEPNARSY